MFGGTLRSFCAVMSFCFCLFFITECMCLHEILGAIVCSWVKVGVLGVLELRNTTVFVVVLSMK